MSADANGGEGAQPSAQQSWNLGCNLKRRDSRPLWFVFSAAQALFDPSEPIEDVFERRKEQTTRGLAQDKPAHQLAKSLIRRKRPCGSRGGASAREERHQELRGDELGGAQRVELLEARMLPPTDLPT